MTQTVIKVKKLENIIDKLIGLSFNKDISAVYFQTRWGIHTFFVNQAIDVFICDDKFRVRKIVRNLRPWKILFWNPKYDNVIEAATNHTIFKSIKLGSHLKIEIL